MDNNNERGHGGQMTICFPAKTAALRLVMNKIISDVIIKILRHAPGQRREPNIFS